MYCAHCGAQTQAPCHQCGRAPEVAGRYRLVEPLERTDHAARWRAEVMGQSVHVVIGGERVAREATALREVTLPCAPRLIEHRQLELGDRPRHVLIHAPPDGEPLSRHLEGPRPTIDQVLDWAEHLLLVLEDLARLAPPVVHGDLTPAHVTQARDGGIVLTAFGAVDDGTFGYQAPEQYGGERLPASDQYALGATVVHLLTRRPPASLVDHVRNVRWHDHVSLPSALTAWLDRLLAQAPGARFASAHDARLALRAARERPEHAQLDASTTLDQPASAFDMAPFGISMTDHVRFVGAGFGLAALIQGLSLLGGVVAVLASVVEVAMGGSLFAFAVGLLPMLFATIALPSVFALAFAYVSHALLMRQGLKVERLFGIEQPIRSLGLYCAVAAAFILPLYIGVPLALYAGMVLTRPTVEPLLGPGLTLPVDG